MDSTSTTRSLDDLLTELLELVSLERNALVRLDLEALEGFAARKEALDQELKGASGTQEPRHRIRLKAVAHELTRNQMLVVHARAQVLGALALLSGSPTGIGAGRQLPSGAVRLNMRG